MASIECTGCSKKFTWKPALAGKSGKCPCGSIVAFPADDPAANPLDLYDFAEVPETKPTPAPVARVAAPAPVAAMPAPSRPIGYASPKTGAKSKREKEIEESGGNQFSMGLGTFRDMILPFALIAIGLGSAGGLAYAHAGEIGAGVAILLVVLYTLVSVPVFIGVAFVSCGWLGISYGPVVQAVIKLVSIAVVSVGIRIASDMLGGSFAMMGMIAGGVITTALLLKALFDFELMDALYAAMINNLAQTVAFFAIGMIIYKAAASSEDDPTDPFGTPPAVVSPGGNTPAGKTPAGRAPNNTPAPADDGE